jgi:hypothetical protein
MKLGSCASSFQQTTYNRTCLTELHRRTFRRLRARAEAAVWCSIARYSALMVTWSRYRC